MRTLWLSTRITLVTTFVVIITTVFMSFCVYIFLTKINEARNRETYNSHVKLLEQSLNLALQKLSDDVKIISRTPPIQGIIRSQNNIKLDTEDNSNEEQWKDRLSKIFESTLSENEFYTQLRYITVAHNGQEIVRVNQNRNEIYWVTGDALQQKGQRDYFKEGIQLSRGSTIFSNFSLNVEQGKIEIPEIVTIRVISPVYDDKTQQVFGLLVLNVDILDYLRNILSSLSEEYNVVIFDSAGNFISYISGESSIDFNKIDNINQFLNLHTSTTYNTPNTTSNKPETNQASQIITNTIDNIKSNKALYFTEIPIYHDNKRMVSNYHALIYSNAKEHSNIEKKDEYILMFLLVFIAIVSSWVVNTYTKFSLRKLHDLAESLSYNHDSQSNIHFYTSLNDEVGILARAVEEKTRELELMANSDSLTGLPNRNDLNKNFKSIVDKARVHANKFAFLFIDINSFKAINDSCGHDFGDQILIAVANRIRSGIRKKDYCARLSGDEFVVIFTEIKDNSFIHSIEKLTQHINGEYIIKNKKIPITISCGVALYPDNGDTYEEISSRADSAMYQSKQAQDGQPVFFKLEP